MNEHRFKLLDLIRENEHVTVSRADDVRRGRLVVLKRLKKEIRDDPHYQTLLRKEVEFLRAVKHPGVLRPLGTYDRGGLAIFRDAQGSVAQYLKQGPLAPPLVESVVRQVLMTLRSMHAQRQGHGSLQPSTLLVDAKGRVILGDFLGYYFGGELPLPDRISYYQAPEILDPQFGFAGPASDLYTLGYTALELLAGDRFQGLFAGVADAQIGQQFAWARWHSDPTKRLLDWRDTLTNVSDPLANIIEGLIAKDLSERFSDAAAVLAEMDRLELPSRALFPPLRSPASAPPRRPVTALTLRSLDAKEKDRQFAANDTVLIGRHPRCNLQLSATKVSGRHAFCVCHDGLWWIYDLNSGAGVAVNDKRVRGAQLNAGDRLRIGASEFEVVLHELVPTAPATAPARPAQKVLEAVDDFSLLELLHNGASGRYFKARWDAKGRTVAIKIFPDNFSQNAEEIRRFLRGIPAAAEIRHPNVVRLYKGGVYKKTWYLAMEYMPGGSLRDVLAARKAPLEPGKVVEFALQICNALQAAFERNLIHRRITPAAILFDKKGTAKLGDFILVRGIVADTLQMVTQGVGALRDCAYHPPEQSLPSYKLNITYDIYSLAASMYEALTCRPPFEGENPVALAKKVYTDAVLPPRQFNPRIPDRLNDLILAALNKNPAERFQNPEQLKTALSTLA